MHRIFCSWTSMNSEQSAVKKIAMNIYGVCSRPIFITFTNIIITTTSTINITSMITKNLRINHHHIQIAIIFITVITTATISSSSTITIIITIINATIINMDFSTRISTIIIAVISYRDIVG
ncbi:hypothetical protein PoB_001952800 [Plakobranchus ocellatus]|uniref:Uncharacterized protein n=1 Tax=Plakobranchus ocellatus TaxID=259542 RepID=A0AAV3ZEY7_9GAST|nr:hypothetical protein PoB_001952800 [Plakobranchus ocellatus]